MKNQTIDYVLRFAAMEEERRTRILLTLIDSQQKPEESESEDGLLNPREYTNE